MASATVGAHLDKETIDQLRGTAAVENRTTSQIQSVAIRSLLDMLPGARRAIFAIHGVADEGERQFAARAMGRAALVAYERIIDTRQQQRHHPDTNRELDTEEAIEAEAVRLCLP